MSLINFVIVKPKLSLQLEVPSDSTFLDVSDLILKHFNLNRKDFPETKEYSLKFIFNSKVCQNEKTLNSYNITSQSKITVYIPKVIISAFSFSNSQDTPKISDGNSAHTEKIASEENLNDNSLNKKESQKIDDLNNTNQPVEAQKTISSNTSDTINSNDQIQTTNKSETPTNNSNIDDSTNEQDDLFGPSPSQFLDDEKMHSTIISLADPKFLNSMIELGFDKVDAAYSLIYKKNIENSIDLITLGISTDPEYRFHVNEILSGRLTPNQEIIHEIQLSMFEARKKGEDEKLALCTAISEMAVINRIEDISLKKKLSKKRNELSEYIQKSTFKLQENFQNGKQILYYNHKTKTPHAIDFQQFLLYYSQYFSPNNQEAMHNQQMMYPQMFYQLTPNQQMMSSQMMNPQMMNQQMMNPMMMNQQAVFQKSKVDLVNEKFNSILLNFGSMTPENYTNPFAAVYEDAIPHVNENTRNIMEYGKTMDYYQLNYLYRMVTQKNVEMNEAVQYLIVCDGDIVAAEQLVASIQ